MRCLPLLLALFVAGPALSARAAEPAAAAPAAVLFHGDGRPATLAAVVAATRQADVLFVGESHDDPAAHALEQAVFEAVAAGAGDRPVALSLEMFDRDVQPVLDEYLAGLIREKDLSAAARPWPNYGSDYRPLVEVARARKLPVLAADPPARYASRVGRLGIDALQALPPAAQRWLAPSPWPTPSQAYAAKFRAFATEATGPGHGPANEAALRAMFEAQWLRDTTMAATMADWLRGRPGLVVHVTGIFHTAKGLGTPEALKHYRPGTRAVVLAIMRDAAYPAFKPEAMAGAGDFVAVTPAQKP